MKTTYPFTIFLLLAFLLLILVGCVAEAPADPPPAPTPTTGFSDPAPTALPSPTATPIPAAAPIPALTKDLPYTIPLAAAVLEQKLDVYTSAQIQENGWPVVVIAPGFMQKKRDFKSLSEAIAGQGAVVFTLDWPTYSGSSLVRQNGKQVREMSETLVCAVRFAGAHAREFGGDPDRLTLLGFSLGAGMGGLTALAGASLEVEWSTLAGQSGEPIDPLDCIAPEGSAGVDAFIGIAGPYQLFDGIHTDYPQLWDIAAPAAHVGENPTLIVRLLHGAVDARVPQSASETFQAALVAAGYDATLTLFDEGHKVPHALTLAVLAELAQDLK